MPLLLVLFVLFGSPSYAASILSFSPQGSQKEVSQVQVRFESDMIAFGNSRAPSPFDVQCSARGQGRWLDARTFIYDFVGVLPGGLRCTFRLSQRQDLQAEILSGTKEFSFDTGGPRFNRSIPSAGSTYVNEEEPFLLVLDAPIQKEQWRQKIFFQVPQRADTIGVELLANAEQYIEEHWPYLKDQLKGKPYLLIKPKERLPAQTEINLVLDKGLSSPDGVATLRPEVLGFTTRPALLAQLSCEKEKPEGPCTPWGDLSLSFSAEIPAEQLQRIRIENQKQEQLTPEISGYSVSIPGPHPPLSSYRLFVPAGLKDVQGRILSNPQDFPLRIQVGDYGPLLKFPGSFGVLEAAHAIWPIHLRKVEASLKAQLLKVPANPEELLRWYTEIKSLGYYEKREQSIFQGVPESSLQAITLPKPNGPEAFEVIGLPLAGPGYYLMETSSQRLGNALLQKPQPMFARGSVLVTNMAVHVKVGRKGALVWVTSLDQGKPVTGAKVSLADCMGKVLVTGLTDASGIFQSKGALFSSTDRCPQNRGYYFSSNDYLVMAQLKDDFSFTLTQWNEGIENWRFQLPWDRTESELQLHTVMDRSLLRLGETLSMVHHARRRTPRGLVMPYYNSLPDQVIFRHIGSDKSYPEALKWQTSAGRAEQSWKIPLDAPLGWYAIEIKGQESGRFRLDEFRLASMRGVLRVKPETLIAPQALSYDFELSYLGGGPASQQSVRLRRLIVDLFRAEFKDYPDYNFQIGPKIVDQDRAKLNENGHQEQKLETRDSQLNKQGTGSLQWPMAPIQTAKRVQTEMEFNDANGEARTVAIEDKVWPSGLVIGMKASPWLQKNEELKLSGITLDPSGKVLPHQEVTVKLLEEKVLSHRRRGVAGTYVYEHKTEFKDLGVFCRSQSDEQGLWSCQKPISTSGSLILQAEGKDKEGRLSISHQELWVAGQRLWFPAEDHDRMDLIAEKKRYEPGETARLQVKMPFAEASVLVAIEADGAILERKVVTLKAEQPFIEVPILRSYAPNIFVSAWAVRGRIKGTEPLLKVDLGKPAFKLGIAELKVGWREHTLKVKIATDKKIFAPREKIKVKIDVLMPTSEPLPAPALVSFALVDEALLELMENRSWDLLTAMMAERAYGIGNATAAMQILGKRHFGLKALPHGGGGGGQPTREILDALIYWQGTVPLHQGTATLELPLKDHLSSLRLVAVAQAGTDLFGTTSTRIETRQDLSLIAGLPPLVREGDRWQAMVTVRNTSALPQRVTVKARMENDELPERVLTLKANESQILIWEIKVPTGVSQLRYQFQASSQLGAHDKLSLTQKVIPAIPLRVLQSSLLVLGEAQSLGVSLPEKADPKRGGLQLSFSSGPGLDALAGAKLYFQNYPYQCLEQRLSSAIGLDDQKALSQLVKDLPSYRDGQGLLKYFSNLREGSVALTAYVLSASHQAGLTLPPHLEESLRESLKRFLNGQVQDLEPKMPGDQLIYRKIMVIEALSRFDKSMIAELKSLDLKPELLPSNSLIDLIFALSRAGDEPETKAWRDLALEKLKGRLRLSGTQFGLAGEDDSAISSLLSDADSNTARLLLMGLDFGIWQEDQARLFEGLVRRQKRGAWSTTVANAWASLALRKYQQLHPAPGTSTQVLLSWKQQTQTVTLPSQEKVNLSWPEARETLKLQRQGQGEVWATVLSSAAIPLAEPFQSGYKLSKSYAPVEQKSKGKWSRGDLVQVSFQWEAGSDQTWVVLADPIPAGARILSSSLRESKTDGKYRALNPSYVERRHVGYFAYFEWMPKGTYQLSYVMQLNNPGLFQMNSTRLEAMYAPDLYAEIPNAVFQVD